MTKQYTFNYESKSIVILSSSFAKKAGIPGTKESAILVDLMTQFPGYSIVKGYTEKIRSNKYKNITYVSSTIYPSLSSIMTNPLSVLMFPIIKYPLPMQMAFRSFGRR